ncbi:MAG: hypothetical protein WD336_11700 [Trueperaceae bacterium]
MIATERSTPACLGGHPGELIREDDALLWRGSITPDLVADLMQGAVSGTLPVRADGADEAMVLVQRLWFDPTRRRMVVHLRDRSAMA